MESQRTAVDPVCGMTVDPAKSEHRSVREERTYYFCSSGCKESFDGEPGKYLGGDKGAA